jgi:hypothetical protein
VRHETGNFRLNKCFALLCSSGVAMVTVILVYVMFPFGS